MIIILLAASALFDATRFTQYQSLMQSIQAHSQPNAPRMEKKKQASAHLSRHSIQARKIRSITKKYFGDCLNSDLLPVLSNNGAGQTLYVFFDYNCGPCLVSMKDVTVLGSDDRDLRIVLLPLPGHFSSSRLAAKTAMLAASLGKFGKFHSALIKMNGARSSRNIAAAARSAGLPENALSKAVETQEFDQILEHVEQLARELGVRGSPAYLTNTGRLQRGALKLHELRLLVPKSRNWNDRRAIRPKS